MLAVILRRLASAIPILIIVSLGIFSLTALVPGNAAAVLAGNEASQEDVDRIAAELGLDKPFWVAYGHWLWHALQLDFGHSALTGYSISDDLARRFPYTLQLALFASVLALAIAIPVAIFAARRPGGWFDQITRVYSSGFMSMPSFWLGPLLILAFAIYNPIFPSSGFVLITESFPEFLRHGFVPAITLGLLMSATIIRQLRNSLIDALGSNYIRTLWAKGASERRVIGLHGLRNAAIPAVTIFGASFSGLLGGTLIIEKVFGIPGLGTYALTAVGNRDVQAIQASAMLFAVLTIAVNLLVDIAYSALNPKVRAQ
ncbi:ABC transporter permease [Microbacterium sp. A588]